MEGPCAGVAIIVADLGLADLGIKQKGRQLLDGPVMRVTENIGSIALQPAYCRVAYAVAPTDIRKRFTITSTL